MANLRLINILDCDTIVGFNSDTLVQQLTKFILLHFPNIEKEDVEAISIIVTNEVSFSLSEHMTGEAYTRHDILLDMVEKIFMKLEYFDIAKAFILYRGLSERKLEYTTIMI